MSKTDYADILAFLRAKGMTLKGVAHACECSPHYLYNITKGQTTDPRASVADKLRQLKEKLNA